MAHLQVRWWIKIKRQGVLLLLKHHFLLVVIEEFPVEVPFGNEGPMAPCAILTLPKQRGECVSIGLLTSLVVDMLYVLLDEHSGRTPTLRKPGAQAEAKAQLFAATEAIGIIKRWDIALDMPSIHTFYRKVIVTPALFAVATRK